MAIDNLDNQMQVLIDFKGNFKEAQASLEEYLRLTQTKITELETKLGALKDKNSKTSQKQYEAGKQELDTLYKTKAVTEQLAQEKAKMSQYTGEMNKQNKVNLDNNIREQQLYNQNFTKNLKERLLSEIKEEKDAKAKKLAEEKAWNGDVAKLKAAGNNFNKQSLAEELTTYKNTRREQLAEEKRIANEVARARSKTAIGALENGSTFGHKLVTTAEYAIAGTAIFATAGAFIQLSKAALEADLNMRTMSAVLKLNIGDAIALDESVRKLGETYGGTTTEIEQVAIALGRAGVKTRDIKDATEVVLAMARLTGDTFEQSASAVISYQQVFGDTKNIIELGNKLAYVANVSRLSTQDIGTFSNYALAAAKDVGLTEDAVGGLAAAFSNAGVNASTIGTQIRRFTSLLTESSTDVTDFFKGIGVNQANLLSALQRGGTESNAAMLDFVNTLSKVNSAKFTSLVGQMDILAGNSLKLMRNNSSNITKYVQDLQTGVSDQLENTRVILDSYIVTFESMWNSLKNKMTEIAQSDIMSGILTGISAATNTAFGNTEAAGKQFAALHKKSLEQQLADLDKSNNEKKISDEEYLVKRTDIQAQLLQLDKNVNALVVKEHKATIDELVKQTDGQIDIINKRLSSGTLNEKDTLAAATVLSQLVDKKKDLVKVEKEQVNNTDNLINKTVDSTMSLDKQLSVINQLKSAKMDSSYQEKLFNETADASIKKNNELIDTQLVNLDKYAGMKERLQGIIGSAKGNSSELDKLLSQRVVAIRDTKTNNETDKQALLEEANVIKTIRDINDANNIILGKKASLIGKNLKDEEKAQRDAERAQRKVESDADKAKKIADENDQAKTKIAELSRQINGEEELTLGKAQSKLNIDTQLVALAYEKYQAAVGTKNESAMERDYNQAMAQYLQTSYVYINKIVDKEKARTEFNLEMTQSLDVAIEKERVRLGIVEKATDTEYAQLSLKYEKKKAAGDLNEDEIAYYEKRLAELDTLNKKKKDVSTLAMEYQREIAEQDSVGYMASKAGLAGLESGMMEFFDVTSQGWLDWHNLVKGILSSIYKELLQQLIIKQAVAGISAGIGAAFGTPTASAGTYGGVTSSVIVPEAAPTYSAFPSVPSGWATGGMLPTKGYASGGVLSGGTGIRDDIYLGNVSGTQVFAMGGEFITRKDAVNPETKGTLDYINKTGSVPNQGSNVNVPVSINIENQSGQGISADMISQMTKQNDKGDYEKVINIVLKASQTDPRLRSLLKGK